MLTVCQAQFYVLHVGELISPYDSPIRVDTVVILTLERKKLRHREVDPGIFTLELTLLMDCMAFQRYSRTTLSRWGDWWARGYPVDESHLTLKPRLSPQHHIDSVYWEELGCTATRNGQEQYGLQRTVNSRISNWKISPKDSAVDLWADVKWWIFLADVAPRFRGVAHLLSLVVNEWMSHSQGKNWKLAPQWFIVM